MGGRRRTPSCLSRRGIEPGRAPHRHSGPPSCAVGDGFLSSSSWPHLDWCLCWLSPSSFIRINEEGDVGGLPRLSLHHSLRDTVSVRAWSAFTPPTSNIHTSHTTHHTQWRYCYSMRLSAQTHHHTDTHGPIHLPSSVSQGSGALSQDVVRRGHATPCSPIKV